MKQNSFQWNYKLAPPENFSRKRYHETLETKISTEFFQTLAPQKINTTKNLNQNRPLLQGNPFPETLETKI